MVVASLSGEEKENKAATDAWIKSLEAYENLMVVGFGDRNAITMIPLYDLVDVTKEGGEERRAMMMAYMLTGMMEDDAAEHESRQQTERRELRHADQTIFLLHLP